MKALKIIGNILGILLATVLSIVLIVVLIAMPVLSAASSFTQGETLHQVMEEIDYTEVITSAAVNAGVVSEDLTGAVEVQGISADIVQDIMGSDAVGEVLDLYMDDAFAALEGNGGEVSLTPEALQGIAGEHMDELVDIAKNFLGEDMELTDAQVEEFVNMTIEENAETIIEMLPSVGEILPVVGETAQPSADGSSAGIGNSSNTSVAQENAAVEAVTTMPDSMLVDALVSLRNGTSMVAIVIVAAVLSLLILLCRIKRFRGFMWLGVVYLLSAGLTLGMSMLVKGRTMVQLLDMGSAEAILSPILTVMSAQMLKTAMIVAICAVVFIVVFAVGRLVQNKKLKSVVEA